MKERNSNFQFAKDVFFETDKDLKTHIAPSPPVKVRMPVKREPNVPLWESEWKEGEKLLFGNDNKKCSIPQTRA